MQISQLLKLEGIQLELSSLNKESVLKELAALLEKTDCLNDQEQFLQAIWEREAKSSTGIGFGVAIPHGKSNAVKRAGIAFGYSKGGIDYQSLDEKPAHIFFMIAVPEASEDEHLQVLAKLSRMLVYEDFRQQLAHLTSKENLIEIIESKE